MKIRAFSLIELLVAISVLAVMAAIIVPKFLNVRDNAAQTVAEAQIKALNRVYNNWIALGGKADAGANGMTVIMFITRKPDLDADNNPTPRATFGFCSDSPGKFGSASVYFPTTPVGISTVPTSTTLNGFKYINITNDVFYKYDNFYWPITWTQNGGFVLGSRTNCE